MEPQGEFAVVGTVVSRWGQTGLIRVKPFTDNPERFSPGQSFYILGQCFRAQEMRPHKGDVLLKLEGVDSADAAAALERASVEVPLAWLAQLPEDSYYHFQLIGLEVWTTTGEYLGKVASILETGSNDVYVVQGGEREVLLPAIGQVIETVDVAAGRITVTLLEGL